MRWVEKFFGTKTIEISKTKEFIFSDVTLSPAYKFIPEWYKKIKPYHEDKKFFPTIKKCAPVLDAISHGYMIYTSEDLYFDEDSKKFNEFESLSENHPNEQINGYPIPDEYHKIVFKWDNHINIKTPKKYSCLFIHPMHRMDLPFYTLPGMVDTDMHPLNVNFPFFMKKNFSGVIPSGTPIVQVIPIKRISWRTKINKKNKEINNTQKFEERFKKLGYEEINDVYKNYYRERKDFS